MNRQQGQKRTVPSRVPLELLPMPDEAGVRPVGHAADPGAARSACRTRIPRTTPARRADEGAAMIR